MNSKVRYKQIAYDLRRQGYSYGEIRKEIPVSKSTLSLWLKDLSLTDSEKDAAEERRNRDASRWRTAAKVSRKRRMEEESHIFKIQEREAFDRNVSDPFFQVGLALYWAEGAKASSSFAFTHSDPEMVRLMLAWVRKYLKVEEGEIGMRIYTYKSFNHGNQEALWAFACGVPAARFKKTLYKNEPLSRKRSANVLGSARIELGRAAYLRRMILWQQMLIEHYKKQG